MSILLNRKWLSFLTRRCDSVLPGGLVVAQGKQQGLDGSDEDSSQASIEDDVEQQDFDCKKRRKISWRNSVNQVSIPCTRYLYHVKSHTKNVPF